MGDDSLNCHIFDTMARDCKFNHCLPIVAQLVHCNSDSK